PVVDVANVARLGERHVVVGEPVVVVIDRAAVVEPELVAMDDWLTSDVDAEAVPGVGGTVVEEGPASGGLAPGPAVVAIDQPRLPAMLDGGKNVQGAEVEIPP